MGDGSLDKRDTGNTCIGFFEFTKVGLDRLDQNCPHDAPPDKLADRISRCSVAGADLDEAASDPPGKLICQRQLHGGERSRRNRAA